MTLLTNQLHLTILVFVSQAKVIGLDLKLSSQSQVCLKVYGFDMPTNKGYTDKELHRKDQDLETMKADESNSELRILQNCELSHKELTKYTRKKRQHFKHFEKGRL